MRQFTMQRAMFIILFALLFAMATRIPVDTDTWWHIRSGEHILNEGFIYTDPFSHTKLGETWINHSWGSQVVMYLIWQLAGNMGLAVFTAGLATGGMYFIYRSGSGNIYLRAFVLVIAAATAAVFWSARPQMFSFFLSTVVYYLLHLFKHKKIDRLWLLIPLMLIWGNLHAGFSIGFIIIGGFIAGEILSCIFSPNASNNIGWGGVRRLIIIGFASAVALVINPYGLDMLRVPFATVSIGALRDFIQEWNSPNFHERQTWPFIMMVVAFLGAVGASSKRLSWSDFVLVSGTFFMGLLAGRNISVFAVVAAPPIMAHLDDVFTERGWVLRPRKTVSPRMAWVNVLLTGIIVLGALAQVINILDSEFVAEAQADFLPVGAAEYLNEARPPGPMFNSYNWGGYLMFAAPDYPVFVDGRTDLYGDEFLTRWLRVATGGDEWREVFTEYDIRLAVIEPQSGLARILREENGWHVAYEDDMAVIFVREDAS